MNGGATAPSWADAAGGAWSVKSSGTTTGTLPSWTGLTKTSWLWLEEVQYSGGGHYFQTSSDNGVSWDSGASDYHQWGAYTRSTPSALAPDIGLTGVLGTNFGTSGTSKYNAAPGQFIGWLMIFSPANTTDATHFEMHFQNP